MRAAINGWFWNQAHTGSGQYTRQLLTHLLAIAPQHEYILLTPEGAQPITPDLLAQRPTLDARRLGLGKVWFEQVGFARACRRLRADVALAPYWAPPFKPSVPTLVTIHDIIPLLLPEYNQRALLRLYFGLVRRTTHKASLVLTDSAASQSDIVAHLNLPAERVRVIYLAADAVFRPKPAPDDQAICVQYGLPDHYALYLGSFERRKNLAGLLRAWRLLPDPPVPLVIAGRFSQHSSFAPDPRRLVSELGVNPDTVMYVDSPPEVHKPALYRRALCFLFASRYEGFGLPPLEAMSCGAPVVGSNASSIPEVVGAGGLLCTLDDAQGLADAMTALFTDPGLHADLRRKALAQAARFSWHQTARDTLAALEEVVEVSR